MYSKKNKSISRRKFVKTTSAAIAGSMIFSPAVSQVFNATSAKKKVAMVGTGSRGTSFFGKFLIQE
ncbi:MAG: twin-arginine translocation signal domain-containing protein, partial [Bacteroidota bacterium]